MNVTYVYALVEPGATRNRRARASRIVRVSGRRIQLVPFGSVHAAIERLAAPPSLSEASLRAQHELVVALGRRFDAILPARFGAAVDMTELERLLTLRQTRLRRALEAVRGREQMTVRIFGPPAPARIAAADATTGTAYLTNRRRMLGGLVPPAGTGIRRAVKPVVARERIDPGQGQVLATLHHLIPRGRAAEYRALVKRSIAHIATEQQVVVSGPWPPFAFTPDLWP